MTIIEKLTEIFGSFPGIGSRQAKRFVFFLLGRGGAYIDELIRLLQNLKKDIKQCPICFRYFAKGTAAENRCQICRDEHRASDVLMIVCRDVDLETLEKSGAFAGRYFVLGGALPILEKNPDRKIRGHELLKAVEKASKDDALKEIILAMNTDPEGENTTDFLHKLLEPLVKKHNIKISLLGRGLSTDAELEYADADTLKNALRNRF
ncbi:MAG: recombination protein RecR [Parcubacteria group bacterium Gr01-1014_73]|nr:MAG: recombination protein RecR [Parcubacteria group bacterium Gr01-1014_73]